MPHPVVLISGNDPTAGHGGHSSYVRAHAYALRQASFDPQIFCVSPRTETVAAPYAVVHRIASPYRPFRHVMMRFHAPRLICAVEQYLTPLPPPHLIHGFQIWTYAAVAAARRLNARGIPTQPVGSTYDTLFHESLGKLASAFHGYGMKEYVRQLVETAWNRVVSHRSESHAYRHARAVFVNYHFVDWLLRESFGPDIPIRHLPYAPETAFRIPQLSALPVPDAIASLRATGVPLIVAVSRHDPRKGLAVLLRALALLAAEGRPFRACLVGRGQLLEFHRSLAARLGLEDLVTIEGFVPESYAYLRHADVFVLPSLEEGSGSISLLEAMQAGTAIVATRIDGIPEDVTDGEGALLVPAGDERALAGALGRLLADAPLRQRLAARAHEVFLQRFSAARLVDALRDEYARLGIVPDYPRSISVTGSALGSPLP
jgi:glycosyltransferase involved in cell wall biosynthesis